MSDTTAADKKNEENGAAPKPPAEEKKKLPQLGALEDDDEFEVSLDPTTTPKATRADTMPGLFSKRSAIRNSIVCIKLIALQPSNLATSLMH